MSQSLGQVAIVVRDYDESVTTGSFAPDYLLTNCRNQSILRNDKMSAVAAHYEKHLGLYHGRLRQFAGPICGKRRHPTSLGPIRSLTNDGLTGSETRLVQGTLSRTHAQQEYSCAHLGPFLVKPARAIASSIVFLLFRSDAAMSESRQTVRDFQPRQLITAMHVELWR
jgi:hypothetical protein